MQREEIAINIEIPDELSRTIKQNRSVAGTLAISAGLLISALIILDSAVKGAPVSMNLFTLRIIGLGVASILILIGMKIINPLLSENIIYR